MQCVLIKKKRSEESEWEKKKTSKAAWTDEAEVLSTESVKMPAKHSFI